MSDEPPAAGTRGSLSDDIQRTLASFVAQSKFATNGGVVTDLDGTAVHEHGGRTIIAAPVESGLAALLAHGRPVVLNSLRFPLSILRAFGREWHRLTGAPVPTVALNGSLIGYIVSQRDGTLAFNEIEAYPLPVEQIDGVIEGVRALVDDGVDDVLLFYYPRNWTRGEVIWTPRVERRASLEAKYDSAREIVASDIEVLRERLHGEDICMMTLLADVASDRRKAYQHTEQQSFITRNGVDKLFGARAIAPYAAIDLEASVGAGDSELDTFLRGVGMAIVVGDTDVVLDGEINTVRLADPPALGALFYELASLIDARSTSAGDDAPRRRAATR